MKTLKDIRKVVVIFLEDYTDIQLSDISRRLGIDNILQQNKKEGIIKMFIDIDTKSIIGAFVDTKSWKGDTYKGLTLINEYTYFSKREKDNLLKMKPTEFLFKIVPVILDVDTILDKITKYGIGSLVKEEKEFLDNL